MQSDREGDSADEKAAELSAGEERETPHYHTEHELELLLARARRENSALLKFQQIERRIRHELKRLPSESSFLAECEQYLLAFKHDEHDPGFDHRNVSEAFRVWGAAELGLDVQSLPVHARPLLLEFSSSFHRWHSASPARFASIFIFLCFEFLNSSVATRVQTLGSRRLPIPLVALQIRHAR